jgi:hypothetical protein
MFAPLWESPIQPLGKRSSDRERNNSGVLLVMAGSLWIRANLNHNMMPVDQIMQMQR